MFKIVDKVVLKVCGKDFKDAIEKKYSTCEELYGNVYVGKIGVVIDTSKNFARVKFNSGEYNEVIYFVKESELELA